MIYIGNDIISRNCPHNRKSFSNPRFLEKAFTANELNRIRSEDISALSYLFWTCKESAYKISMKNGNRKGFSPKNFAVTLTDFFYDKFNNPLSATGNICYENTNFYFHSSLTKNHIHTISSTNAQSISEIRYQVIKSDSPAPEEQVPIIKNNIIKAISESLTICNSDIEIGKNEIGIPFIVFKKNNFKIDISFSHDQNYVAYAFLVLK
ncbi:MAG: 4-phosphopantetheinyl transferase family protein [Bacteroidia bacterium]|nr:4-phosphopantetheinyl transferase family protein [Bacteroidia bacterium]